MGDSIPPRKKRCSENKEIKEMQHHLFETKSSNHIVGHCLNDNWIQRIHIYNMIICSLGNVISDSVDSRERERVSYNTHIMYS